MRRVILLPCSLCLFVAILYLGGEGSPARAGKKALLKLRPVDGELTEAVGHIRHNLRDIDFLVRKQTKDLDRGEVIKRFHDQLAELVKRDKEIGKLGITPADELVRRSVHRDRALSFVHAWYTFSRLTLDARQDREELLALDRPKDDKSALALLLELYSHIRAAEGNVPDPLRARLKSDHCPSTRDLVGTSHDDPKKPREYLSLWALVNLQLDTWRTPEKPNECLARLATWARQLHDNKNLSAFDYQADSQYGQQFKARLDKLQLFLDFRNRYSNRQGLKGLLEELSKPGRENRSPDACPAIKQLATAAKPTEDKESLPQAAVWLRYVILLSYQREGVQIVAGSSNASLAKWWTKLQTDYQLGDFRTGLQLANPVVDGFVRWNAWPKEGHIIHALVHATDAAYRYALWEAERSALEKQRYKTTVNGSTRDAYVKQLKQRVADLDAIYCEDLQCYFPGQESARSFSEWLYATVTIPGKKEGAARYQSSSLDAGERKRIESDLSQLAAMTSSANQMQKAILAAYEAKDPAALSTWLQGPATTDGLARWTPFDLPQRSFNVYYHQVMDSVKRLNDEIKDEQFKADLRRQYNDQIAQNDILADELAIAKLGLEIAEQGKQVADCFKQLAALDKQIADLANDWTQLEKRAKELKVKGAELQLGLAVQARELAAAKLAGLKEALARAKELVKNATAQLESMKPRLLEAAQKIEEQKSKSSFFSILKCIVTVIGAVLTPFVGPEALQIAGTVNQALTIAEKASNIDFKNLGEAIPKLADVAKDAGALTNYAIDRWGGNDLKKLRNDVNQWMDTNGRNLDRLTRDVKKNVEGALNEIKKLKVPAQIEAEVQNLRNFVSAVGSGLPVSLNDGSIQIDVGKLRAEFEKDTALKRLLDKVFQEGGMIVNTLRSDSERIAALTGLDNDKRQRAISDALKDVIRASPPEILDLLGKRDYDAARTKIQHVRDEFKRWVDNAQPDDPALKLLGQILGGGMTIVKDGQGRIIALSPAVNKEMAALKKRVEDFEKKWKKETIEKFRGQIQGKLDDITRQSTEAQKASNEGALRKIAQSEIPQKIDEVNKDLEQLAKEVEAAEAELGDAETKLEIATIDRDVAQLLKEAADKRRQAAGIGVEEAIVKERIATLSVTQASLLMRQKEREILTSVKRLDLNEAKLRHIYAACRRWGVDPNSAPSNDAASEGSSLVDILDVENEKTRRAHAHHLDRAAQGAVGMVQWLRLLNAPKLIQINPKFDQKNPLKGKTCDEWALQEIEKIIDLRWRRDTELATLPKGFEQSAEEWNTLFLDKASVPDEKLGLGRAVGVGGAKIVWFDDVRPNDPLLPLPANVKDIQALDSSSLRKQKKLQFLHQLPENAPSELRRKALGYFKFRFTLDEHDDDEVRSPGFAEVQIASNPSSSYYFLLGDSSLVHERQAGDDSFPVVNLRYLIVPPDNPVGNPMSPFVGPLPVHRLKDKQLSDPLQEIVLLGQIRQRLELWKQLELTGAVGDWTIYILATDVPTEAKRLKCIANCKEKLKLTLRIPYIEVPAK